MTEPIMETKATEATKAPAAQFEYDASALQKYLFPEKKFVEQHPEYDVVCTGIVVFNKEGKLLLVQRAKGEIAFPDFWEIPGGKVDEPDETIVHGAVRELKEEAGMTATRIVRKVGEFGFEVPRRVGPASQWIKYIFEMEVEDADKVVLDPVEHQAYVFASEEEIDKERVGDVGLKYVSPVNKFIHMEAFRLRREAASL